MDQADAQGEEPVALIAGLGNPGERYRLTRHNAGFLVVERLAAKYSLSMQEGMGPSITGSGTVAGRGVALLKPMTYMNRSGEAVVPLMGHLSLIAPQLLVVHDDLDLQMGRLRIARGGGAGGHRGIASIIERLGDRGFPRLKLGIGRPQGGEPIEDYVLGEPYEAEREAFCDMIRRAAEAVELILQSGMATAMNQVNRREPGPGANAAGGESTEVAD